MRWLGVVIVRYTSYCHELTLDGSAQPLLNAHRSLLTRQGSGAVHYTAEQNARDLDSFVDTATFEWQITLLYNRL